MVDSVIDLSSLPAAVEEELTVCQHLCLCPSRLTTLPLTHFCFSSPTHLYFSSFSTYFKGIVHPKMKILSSFTHLQVDSTLYKFISSVEHKRHFEKKKKKVEGPHWRRWSFFHIMESQWGPSTVWLPIFFKISYFVFNRKKETWVGITWGWVNDDRI